jgi:hypothetical protein
VSASLAPVEDLAPPNRGVLLSVIPFLPAQLTALARLTSCGTEPPGNLVADLIRATSQRRDSKRFHAFVLYFFQRAHWTSLWRWFRE